MFDTKNVEEDRRYVLLRLYLTISGLWPYHNFRDRCIRFVPFFAFSFSIAIPQILYLLIGSVTLDDVFESLPSLIISILFSSKLLIIMLYSKKVKICLNTIQKDWQSINTDVERIILQRHTRYGQYLATFYAIFVHTMTTLFMLKPIIVSLITDDNFNTTKSSIPIASRLPFNVEYGEKFNQYIYPIAIHNYMAVFTRSFATIAVDNLYYVLIQHACGMFSIIGNVLENIGKNNANDFNAKSDKIKDNNYSKTLHCLRRHLDVIEFAENIEALFTEIFLINLNLNMICGSLAGVQVLINLERNTSDISVPIIIYTAQFIHLFLHFWNAQFLLDYSVLPYKSICRANWYHTSQKCQKLLLLIMNRTTIPCKITAGKIVILSIESFATVLKTSISYLTMFRSLQ